MRPSLLWIFFLNVYDVQSQCTTNNACWLSNTRGVSTDSFLIPRGSIYPESCLRFCSHSSECVAATYNPNADICELHEAGAEGAPCMTLGTDVGSSFWMMKHPERQCPKVSCAILVLLLYEVITSENTLRVYNAFDVNMSVESTSRQWWCVLTMHGYSKLWQWYRYRRL